MKALCVFAGCLLLSFLAGCHVSRRTTDVSRSRIDREVDYRVDAVIDSVWRAEWRGRGEWEWIHIDCSLDTLRKPGEAPRVSLTRVSRAIDLSTRNELLVADSLAGRMESEAVQKGERSTGYSRNVSSAGVPRILAIVFLGVVILYVYDLIKRR